MSPWRALFAAAASLVAVTAHAAPPPEARFGPFASNVGFREAMEAEPSYDWELIRDRQTGAPIGAAARRPFLFAGIEWRLEIGDRFSPMSPPYNYGYNLNLDIELPAENEAACRRLYSGVVTELERMYGPFGQHPGLRRNSELYGGLGAFTIVRVSENSVARDYGEGHYTTFAEVDEANGDAVMTTVMYLPEYHDCVLRVNAFQSDARVGWAKASRP